jgi:hypothetical protein
MGDDSARSMEPDDDGTLFMEPGGGGERRWRRTDLGKKKEKKKIKNKNDRVERGRVLFVNLTGICKSIVPHQHWQWGLLVRNRVNRVQFDNHCILEQIHTRPVNFCNLAQYRWFCVFATEIWWVFRIFSHSPHENLLVSSH